MIQFIPKKVNKGATPLVTFTLKDNQNPAQIVPRSAITSAVGTLKDSSGNVIADFSNIDLISYFNSDGYFSYLLPANTSIITVEANQSIQSKTENHYLTITVTATVNGDVATFVEVFEIPVANII